MRILLSVNITVFQENALLVEDDCMV